MTDSSAGKEPPPPAPEGSAPGGEQGGSDAADPGWRPGEPSPGDVVNERYRLDRLLSRGPLGTVWAGWDLDLERGVGLKCMAAEFSRDGSLKGRFHGGAKVSARLTTPHVVNVLEFGTEYGATTELSFIAMELLEGEDLGQRLEREQRMDPEELVPVATQVCKALKAAHDADVVHRDLEPGHIFLAREYGEPVVKVLDFGMAKMGDMVPSAQPGVERQSRFYMSPEQARGASVDHRSDLWSVGAILFHALTGEPPFPGDAAADLATAICTGERRKASAVHPGLQRAFDAFFDKALALDFDGRFQGAMELAKAFEEAVKEAQRQALEPPPAPAAEEDEDDDGPISDEDFDEEEATQLYQVPPDDLKALMAKIQAKAAGSPSAEAPEPAVGSEPAAAGAGPADSSPDLGSGPHTPMPESAPGLGSGPHTPMPESAPGLGSGPHTPMPDSAPGLGSGPHTPMPGGSPDAGGGQPVSLTDSSPELIVDRLTPITPLSSPGLSEDALAAPGVPALVPPPSGQVEEELAALPAGDIFSTDFEPSSDDVLPIDGLAEMTEGAPPPTSSSRALGVGRPRQPSLPPPMPDAAAADPDAAGEPSAYLAAYQTKRSGAGLSVLVGVGIAVVVIGAIVG
ncbi:MAG: protein kinase, partial [Deltaproteobacteria bacterium]|nr:protein kinase [Deltaproteobacteria bacterium]